ncbi:MAG: hypothetical protein ACTHLZ_00960 [Tepidisphaeraceae bacterium]
MNSGTEVLDQYYPEMRWRILSLAADLDRIQRHAGGDDLLRSDPRLANLRACLNELLSDSPGRAERVQLILSDRTPVSE